LNQQLKAFCCIFSSGFIAYLGLIYCLPTLPAFWNSLARTQNSWLEWTLALYETYIFPVAITCVLTANLITYITFGSITTGIRYLNEVLKTESDNVKYLAANRAYNCYQIIIDRLTTVFSASILFQEGFLLTSIVTLMAFGIKSTVNSQKDIFLEIWCYGLALEGTLFVILQFYPIIMLYMYSTETLQLMTAVMRKNSMQNK